MPSTSLVPFSSSDLSTQANAVSTMSSREIAELTGKRHDNVVRDIEKMLIDVGQGLLKFEDTYLNEQNGQSYRAYRLPKNLTLNLIAGYRADIRLKIIDRWLEMESAQVQRIPTTFREALLLAADQQAEIEILTPKAEVFDSVVAGTEPRLASLQRRYVGAYNSNR